MRRSFLATSVGALLLTLSACDGDSPSAAPSRTPGASTSPSAAQGEPAVATTAAGAAPTAPTARYTANTKKDCGQVDALFKGKEMQRFAKNLGSLILLKQAKKPVKATRAREAAKKELRSLATAVRRDTGAAQDPELKKAGALTATGIDKSAQNDAFFAKLKTLKDVDNVLEAEMTPWLLPLATHCS
jgi:hypothetical protein